MKTKHPSHLTLVDRNLLTSFPEANKQSGAALMLVIFVLALVSVLSVGIQNRGSLFVQTTSNILSQAQAYEYALAAEVYARRLLKDDWDKDKSTDEFVDDMELVKNSILTPIDNAVAELQAEDLQGRLNLNDILTSKGEVNEIVRDRFKRLFDNLGIESIKIDRLIDWIDNNQDVTGFDGAEDGDYLLLEDPYRSAGAPFESVSELLLLGLDPEEFDKISPHVTALPQGIAKVNVNTATKEVLATLSKESLDNAEIEAMMEKRESEPWKTVDEFASQSEFNGKGLSKKLLSVNTQFFEVSIKISLSDRVARLVSVIYRNGEDGELSVIKRDQSRKYLITKERVTI